MKTSIQIVLMLLGVYVFTGLSAQEDKSLSPYFFVYSDNPEEDQLPLKSTSAEVNISGVIADVIVKQVYTNEGTNPLECKYVFPGSTRAAVYGLSMTIGDRTVVAKIKEKEEARKEYEQAKQEGKRASLLEQKRPNVFEMNVAHIMPGDRIEVELKYTELLVPEAGVYEFAYPTVVGPRYNDQQVPSSEEESGWTSVPYTSSGILPAYSYDMKVNILSGIPIQDVQVQTHDCLFEYPDLRTAKVHLDPSESKGGNRDFVLNYSLRGNEIESGLMLYEGEEENFFMMMVQPPEKVEDADIPAREYVFIVDVSGSMRGFPLDVSKKLLRNLIVNLRPTDHFNVMLFSGGNQVLSPTSLPATEENVDLAVQVIDGYGGGGGTNLMGAMQEALKLPRAEGLSRSVVVVTDGYVSCEPRAFELIRNNLNQCNFFAFGIGSGVNRHLIEGIANVGMGEPLIVLGPEGADEKAEKFRQYINSPVLTQVDVKMEGFDAYDVEPITVPDVLAERPVIVYGKYRGEPKGSISLKGYTGGKRKYKQKFNVAASVPQKDNKALMYLWARKRIKRLSDYQKLSMSTGEGSVKDEVTSLGLKYSLLTQYTSFIAVDDRVVNDKGDLKKVKQPLPLPQGVSNSAVGFDFGVSGVSKANKSCMHAFSQSIEAKGLLLDNSNSAEANKIIEEAISRLTLNANQKITVEFEVGPNGELEAIKIYGAGLIPSDKKIIEDWLKTMDLKGLKSEEHVRFILNKL